VASTVAQDLMSLYQLAGATPEQVKAGMDAWMEWAQRRGDAVVDLGVPLGEARRIDPKSVAPSSSQVAGYSILQADSLEGAVELLRDHPHPAHAGRQFDRGA
jgi:hypothetical protein